MPQCVPMNARRENQIAWMLILGIGLCLVGMVVTFLAFGSATRMNSKTPLLFIALGPLLFVGGVLLAGWGVFFGHLTNRSANNSGVRWLPNCYVIGRFAVNEIGEMIFSDFEDLDSPKAKFIIQLKTSDGRQEEFECSRELIGQIGEGMVGNVQVKGRWLGSFTPVPRPN